MYKLFFKSICWFVGLFFTIGVTFANDAEVVKITYKNNTEYNYSMIYAATHHKVQDDNYVLHNTFPGFELSAKESKTIVGLAESHHPAGTPYHIADYGFFSIRGDGGEGFAIHTEGYIDDARRTGFVTFDLGETVANLPISVIRWAGDDNATILVCVTSDGDKPCFAWKFQDRQNLIDALSYWIDPDKEIDELSIINETDNTNDQTIVLHVDIVSRTQNW